MLFPSAPWNSPKVLPWVIMIFAALNVIFLGGKRRAFGSFVTVLKDEYKNISLAELNWIGDSYAALGYMTTGISISLVLYFSRRYAIFQMLGSGFVLLSCLTSSLVPNPHWLFLTHTLFHGIGSSLILSVVGLVVNEHFPKSHPYHLLATTLISGGSVASIVFVTLFAELIEDFKWRTAFILLGVIYFVVNSSAALFFTKNPELDQVPESKRMSCKCDGTVKQRHVPLLILWFIDRVMTSVVTYGLLLNLTDYVHRNTPSIVSSTILTTLFAAGEASTYVIGAVITAATKNLFKNRLRYILLVTSAIMSTSLFLLEFLAGIQLARRMLCFIAGFCLGPSITFLFPAGEELTRLPGYIAYPFSLGGMGFGMMISPMLTAKIAETFKYKNFFFIQGGLIGLKTACLLIITIILFVYEIRGIYEPTDEIDEYIGIKDPAKDSQKQNNNLSDSDDDDDDDDNLKKGFSDKEDKENEKSKLIR